MNRMYRIAFFALIILSAPAAAREKWTVEQAAEWHKKHPFLVGCNYVPAYAINQLEMWQADTFDLAAIDRELGWARKLGFNSVRVFLHDLLWKQEGFLERAEKFLATADKHQIGVMFVLLDAVWDPFPKAGKQRAHKPHVHNSGWVQSPGLEILKDPKRHDELEDYVKGVVRHFRNDRRVHAWDVFNEPDNRNSGSYEQHEPKDKAKLSLMLLEKVFAWARSVDPSQPLTAGVWHGEWSEKKLIPFNRYLLEQSDVISFHAYSPLADVKKRVDELKRFGRPILCTEYMARPAGSTFDPILGYFKENQIGAYNWGFVSGKSQTIYPWDSWRKKYTAEPEVWFHDIFRADGTPYRAEEVRYIQQVLGAKQ